MKKINVAYIIPSLDVGGSEKKVLDLASGLNRDKFNPIIITITKTGALLTKANELNIAVFCVNKKSKFDVFVVRRISKVLKENSVDIVHVFTSTGKLWGRLGAIKAKTKVIISTEESLFRNKFIDRLLEKRLNKKTSLIIANSYATKESALVATKIKEVKYKVIHNGIFLVPFYKAERLGIINKENDEKIIMCVARLESRKRQDLLIDAFYEIKNKVKAKLVLVGGGPLENDLRDYVKMLRIEDRVVLLGSRNDVPNLLKEADLFVLPSAEEGFGNVIIEAMAARVCVVAANVGGIPEIIKHEKTGILFERNDLDSLKNSLLLALENNELRDSLVREAFKNVDSFSLEKMVNQHEEVYQELIERGK